MCGFGLSPLKKAVAELPKVQRDERQMLWKVMVQGQCVVYSHGASYRVTRDRCGCLLYLVIEELHCKNYRKLAAVILSCRKVILPPQGQFSCELCAVGASGYPN